MVNMAISRDAQRIIAEVNKKMKQDDLVILGSAMTPVQRITSGSLALDVHLGGGWPLNRVVEIVGDPSNGKALDVDTPIPTPNGWTTMGKLQVGDQVFGEDGHPCNVTFVTDYQFDRTCYEVTFSDGSVIVADAEHRWSVQERSKGGRKVPGRRVVTTQQMIDEGYLSGQHWRFRVPVSAPVQYPSRSLPVDPYVLGYWLGDGTTVQATISVGFTVLDEVVGQFASRGYTLQNLRKDKTAYVATFLPPGGVKHTGSSLQGLLRKAGVLGDKFVPEEYLLSSVDDRMSLLRGLLDSDGYVAKSGQVEFVSTNQRLAAQVLELVSSLGIKASMYEGDATLNGRVTSRKYRVVFYTKKPIFTLQHKKARLGAGSGRGEGFRSITSISPVESRPVKCITVDSPDHLYLAGHTYISTHNTATLLKTVAANQARDPEWTCVWVAAEDYDSSWAEKCGVDNNRIILIQTNIMEHAYEVALKFMESKSVDAVVIDSLPALVATIEDDKTMEESTVGKNALLTNKFFRKAIPAMHRAADGSERGCTLFVINQWREKIGVMYGDPRTTPGGKGKDYAYSIKVEARRDDWLEEGTGDSKTKVGLTIAYRSTKNKTAPIGNKAFVDFYFKDGEFVDAGNFDFGKEIVALAILNGVIERKGAYFYYGNGQWQGTKALLEQIRSDLTLKDALEKEVLNLTRLNAAAASDEDSVDDED